MPFAFRSGNVSESQVNLQWAAENSNFVLYVRENSSKILKSLLSFGVHLKLIFSMFYLNLYTWKLELFFQGNLKTKWILRSNLEFSVREQSKQVFGNRGDFGHFSREHKNTDCPWGPP